MTDLDIRMAVAAQVGWFDFRRDLHDPSILLGTKSFGVIGCEEMEVPHLTLDLMHEVEKALNNDQWCVYMGYLVRICPSRAGSANALQRAEAFLKMVGKWVEAPAHG